MDNTLSKSEESKTSGFTFANGDPPRPTPQTVVILAEPQRLALEWLTGGGSVNEASEYAGVCRQTVSRWLNHDPDFLHAFETWRQQADTLNRARLQVLSESALETVADAIRQKRDARVALVVLKGLGLLGTPK